MAGAIPYRSVVRMHLGAIADHLRFGDLGAARLYVRTLREHIARPPDPRAVPILRDEARRALPEHAFVHQELVGRSAPHADAAHYVVLALRRLAADGTTPHTVATWDRAALELGPPPSRSGGRRARA